MTRVVLLPLGFVVTARTDSESKNKKGEIVKDRDYTTSHVGGALARRTGEALVEEESTTDATIDL